MGRPLIGEQPAKVFFAARFTQTEAETLSRAIRQAKQSKSQWVRTILLSAAKETK